MWHGTMQVLGVGEAMKRREFIPILGGAVAWPLAARGQQQGRVRRVGVLVGWEENNPQQKHLLSMLTHRLQELGWTEGSNIRLDVRWTAGNVDRMQVFAKELVGLGPDVILASTTPVITALHRETRTVPIVFLYVSDPVGAGVIANLSRPGANITGINNLEATMGGKWLELLKEIAPSVKRVAMMFNPDTAPGGGSYFLPSFNAAARSLNITPVAAPARSDAEIETAITMLGHDGGGLVVQSDGFMFVHRAKIISLATENNVPTVSDRTLPAEEGGLLMYGPFNDEMFLAAILYVDRILRGAKPADLPVQVPTKFELNINRKTAKALGLSVPATLLARADEVIE